MATAGRIGVLANLCLGSFNKQILIRSSIELHDFNNIRFYSKKITGNLGGKVDAKAKLGVQKSTKQKLQPVLDPELLVTRLCGGNYFVEGEDPLLKPDSEYPEWLWDLRIEYTTRSIEEFTPDTWEYWNRVRRLDKKRRGLEVKLKYKQHRFSNPPIFKTYPKEFDY